MSRISPIRPTGCILAIAAWVSGGFIGVLMMPAATAFTRMPREAYSMASDLVAAFSPPLVSEASTAGRPLIGWSARLVVIWTIWPEPWASITLVAAWLTKKKPARLVLM